MLAALAAAAACASPAAPACDFHEPSAMARGMMNWAYPDSLHVSTAVWRAQSAGALEGDAVAQGPHMLAYARTAFELRRLSKLLDDARGSGARASLAVVLLGPMLWSRFESVGGSVILEVHAEGPAPGDAVVVTEAPVVAALVTGRLGARDAIEIGVVRLYGSDAAVKSAHDWLSAIRP
jgi:hypothetical protein